MGEIPVLVLTREAGADLTDHQYGAVTLDGNGKAVKAAAGVKIFGILQEPTKAGAAAPIMVVGVSQAKFSGAAVPGDELVTDANGLFKVDGAVATKTGASAIDNVAVNGITGVLIR